jgi:hypothetical protein
MYFDSLVFTHEPFRRVSVYRQPAKETPQVRDDVLQ